MQEFWNSTVYFGVLLSLGSYGIGVCVQKKLHNKLFNPLLIGVAITISFLLVAKIPYETYAKGADYLSYLLTPATICLAVPLYEQFELLRKHAVAVILGMIAGVLASILTVFLLALVFQFSHAEYVTFLPKSITTAIGMGVSEELGGYVSITVAAIVITGILGNVMADGICRLFRITHPIAKGIAIGSSAHAIGTARAMEMGEVEGAMSSLSIVVSGLLTVIAAGVFGQILG